MSFQHVVMSIKNAIFKSQPSTPVQAFASMRSWNKDMSMHQEREVWGEIEQRYHEKMGLDMEMDKEGATLMK
jgi:hypothetical protein